MKTTTILAAILAMLNYSLAATVSSEFLSRLAQVESGVDDSAVNAAENAHGRYQIRAAYLADANESLGTNYTLADMHDPAKAEAVVRTYLLRYGQSYERRTGRLADEVVLARIHNGGPRGAEKACTLGYAAKFREAR